MSQNRWLTGGWATEFILGGVVASVAGLRFEFAISI